MLIEAQIARVVEHDRSLGLQSGKSLAPVDVAYETYGKLNAAGDNVILICHALSGNAHVAGVNNPNDKKPGWWDVMVGPGKGIDTNKYFVICSNFLGGCSGTTGPSSINPATGKPYGLDFPIITIADMVKVQKLLLDKLGIKKLLAVIGGSMGGMQAIQWVVEYPDLVRAVIPIATTTRLGAQAISFDAVGRNAILADPNFVSGQYYDSQGPAEGLSIARMIGHITYLSEEGMRTKFGRELRTSQDYRYDFSSEFSVETYLDHQGQAFVERFDANSYLYITKAMDYFDIEKDYNSLKEAFARSKSRFLVVSFSSDWLFTPSQSEDIVNALAVNGKDVSYCNIASPYGHDAFLLEPETLGSLISGFLDATYNNILDNHNNSHTSVANPKNDCHSALRTRVDYELIESLIEPRKGVLDVGCGDGELLTRLTRDKKITGRGIELEQNLVIECVNFGIPIIQDDIERGFEKYLNNSFDYVILSHTLHTLQTLRNPEKVFLELLRIGKKVIVSFPNLAYWRSRSQLFFNGTSPVTKHLPFRWYNSPNLHFLSLKDFDLFCKKNNVIIEKRIPLIKNIASPVKFAPNFFAEQVIYVTHR
jgi:homoserine O-acetyltransferase/O-succinyltransferase